MILLTDANILVQQNCPCGSPLRCKCPNHDGVTYMLTDLDLLCLDGESLPSQYVEWSEMKLHEPAGTYGLKASEVFITINMDMCVICMYLPHAVVFHW